MSQNTPDPRHPNEHVTHEKAVLRVGGLSEEIDVTFDPQTGITDIDKNSLDAAFNKLRPEIDHMNREEEEFLDAFEKLADSDEVTASDLFGLFSITEEEGDDSSLDL